MIAKASKVLLSLVFIYFFGGVLATFIIEPVSPWQLKNAGDFSQVSIPDTIIGLLLAAILLGIATKLYQISTRVRQASRRKARKSRNSE